MEIKGATYQVFKYQKQDKPHWQLNQTGLIDELEEETVPESIILFGSYASGEDSSGSDIDIAVINGRKTEINVSEYEKELGRKISIQNIDLDEADQNFIETLANGIVLRGYLDT